MYRIRAYRMQVCLYYARGWLSLVTVLYVIELDLR